MKAFCLAEPGNQYAKNAAKLPTRRNAGTVIANADLKTTVFCFTEAKQITYRLASNGAIAKQLPRNTAKISARGLLCSPHFSDTSS